MAPKNIVAQLLNEHKLYEALFDAADDVLYCPHPGEPEKTGYPEDHHNDEAIPRLHAAFLALCDTEVPDLADFEGLTLVGVSQELKTHVMEAVQNYYQVTRYARIPRADVQEMFSKLILALQSVLVAFAAHDADVKEQVRLLLADVKGTGGTTHETEKD